MDAHSIFPRLLPPAPTMHFSILFGFVPLWVTSTCALEGTTFDKRFEPPLDYPPPRTIDEICGPFSKPDQNGTPSTSGKRCAVKGSTASPAVVWKFEYGLSGTNTVGAVLSNSTCIDGFGKLKDHLDLVIPLVGSPYTRTQNITDGWTIT